MDFIKRIYYPYIGLWYTLTSRAQLGTNIYQKDWDVAIILDACRVDAIMQLQSEYDYINNVESVWSVGSSTPEWLINTFTTDWRNQINETTRISANGFDEYILVQENSPPELDKSPFAWTNFNTVSHTEFDLLEILYQGDLHDNRLGTVLPNQVTKRSIVVGRHHEWNRLMIHYIQPHAPYISNKIDNSSEPTEIESRPMWALRHGKMDKQSVWEMYLDNLRLVLDDVGLLLKNLDARKVVITADHGESFGEYGGKFGHIDGYPTPHVRKVPWIETSAEDEDTITPDRKFHGNGSGEKSKLDEEELKSHLKDLGYF